MWWSKNVEENQPVPDEKEYIEVMASDSIIERAEKICIIAGVNIPVVVLQVAKTLEAYDRLDKNIGRKSAVDKIPGDDEDSGQDT